ncbi:DUF3106 domain-containing protein [Piscinibacter koreensis]|uniref:DUF3106 domain-containing protein n=1 Tax=Piscinibacter koreensis TaxID=2742824 RepID=A0A7Y6TWM7_9BURK|nr:DUF3106 domain-containing protein [Schlegelella koreensis]NUZ06156.1 DUF3106 domain-containing protein [Schlegelella koreensis]
MNTRAGLPGRALLGVAREILGGGGALLVLALIASPFATAAAPGAPANAASVASAAAATSATPRGNDGAGRRAASAERGVRWSALTPTQRQVLAPLERDWPSIEPERKQKWLVMAERFHTLPLAEQTRIQERMAEWAKLTPAERGHARMRFQEANRVAADERRQRWLDYQALPPEQKRRLAARAASAPAAEAAAPNALHPVLESSQAKSNVVPNPSLSAQPKTIAPTVVRAGPGATTTLISRRPSPPPHQQTGMPKIAATPEFVDRSTLLPKRGPQAAAIGSPAAPAAPPEPAR